MFFCCLAPLGAVISALWPIWCSLSLAFAQITCWTYLASGTSIRASGRWRAPLTETRRSLRPPESVRWFHPSFLSTKQELWFDLDLCVLLFLFLLFWKVKAMTCSWWKSWTVSFSSLWMIFTRSRKTVPKHIWLAQLQTLRSITVVGWRGWRGWGGGSKREIAKWCPKACNSLRCFEPNISVFLLPPLPSIRQRQSMWKGCRRQRTISLQLPPNCLEVRTALLPPSPSTRRPMLEHYCSHVSASVFNLCFTLLQMFSTIKAFYACLTVSLVNCQSFVFAATCIPPCGQHPLSCPNSSILRKQPSDLSVWLSRFPGGRHSLQLHHLQVWLLWVPSGLSRWVTTSLSLSYSLSLYHPIHPFIIMTHPS